MISPVQPKFERPRRALPWEDVQRLLRAVDTSTACGLRDHALLLMMSTYGLGAGEVIGLQLQDIGWNAGTLQMSRPKTGVNFVLPLLPPVAKVLARYLRHGRPPHTPTRHVFVQMKPTWPIPACHRYHVPVAWLPRCLVPSLRRPAQGRRWRCRELNTTRSNCVS